MILQNTTNVAETNYLNGEPRIVFCLALSDRRADFPFRPFNEIKKMRLQKTPVQISQVYIFEPFTVKTKNICSIGCIVLSHLNIVFFIN